MRGTNRIIQELIQLEQKEKQTKELFHQDILSSRPYRIERLKALDTIYASFRGQATPDEQHTLLLLRIEQQRMEKELYPGLWSSLMRRIRSRWQARQLPKRVDSQYAANEANLRSALKQHGFEDLAADFSKHLRSGQKDFTVHHSFYITESEKIDFDLVFSRGQDGGYGFDRYAAVLSNENKPGEKIRQVFSLRPEEAVNASQAYHLLAGRAVLLQAVDAQHKGQQKWLQLDFTDKEPDGNHVVKYFKPGYGFDLVKALEELRPKEMQFSETKAQLLQALANGERGSVTLRAHGRDRKMLLEVNPQKRCFLFFTADGEPITKAEALGQPKATQVLQLEDHKKISPSTKKGLSAG